MPRSTLRSAFPTFGVSTPLGFLCTLEVDFPRFNPSGSPSMRFFPFTLSSNSEFDFGHGLLVHLKAYELSPVQLLPPLRPTHGSTYCYALKFKVFGLRFVFQRALFFQRKRLYKSLILKSTNFLFFIIFFYKIIYKFLILT